MLSRRVDVKSQGLGKRPDQITLARPLLLWREMNGSGGSRSGAEMVSFRTTRQKLSLLESTKAAEYHTKPRSIRFAPAPLAAPVLSMVYAFAIQSVMVTVEGDAPTGNCVRLRFEAW